MSERSKIHWGVEVATKAAVAVLICVCGGLFNALSTQRNLLTEQDIRLAVLEERLDARAESVREDIAEIKQTCKQLLAYHMNGGNRGAGD